ncbi:MAG: ATP-binding protein [Planctomycetota bacterium]
MKILITGPFSTGKTTLVRQLAQAMQSRAMDVSIVEDVARGCPLPLNENQDLATSCWLLGEQIRQEALALRTSPRLIICDRGIPDFVAHTLYAQDEHQTPDAHLADAFWGTSVAWSSTYDVVFQTHVEAVHIEPDGIRSEDVEYQRRMDAYATKAASTLEISPIPLPASTEARLQMVLDTIDAGDRS